MRERPNFDEVVDSKKNISKKGRNRVATRTPVSVAYRAPTSLEAKFSSIKIITVSYFLTTFN
jgi:23S rRNA maturation mini-RNase III